MTNTEKRKGFTLVELMVIIAIIAILAIVVFLVLNPAEMLRRSRDAGRISSIGTIKAAINLYLVDVSTTNMGVPGTCYLQYAGPAAPATVYEFPNTVPNEAGPTTAYSLSSTSTLACGQWFSSETNPPIASSSRTISTAAAGWIPIPLGLVSNGAPIGQWPTDPAYTAGMPSNGEQSAGRFFSYIPGPSNGQYKLAAKMESLQYSQEGANDTESSDGGTDPAIYEQGSNLSL